MQSYHKALLVLMLVTALVGCGAGIALGGVTGLTLWLASGPSTKAVAGAPDPTRTWPTVTATSTLAAPELAEVPSPTPVDTRTTVPMETPAATHTPTQTSTPVPASPETVQDTATVESASAPPTPTTTATVTPTPDFTFVLIESDAFPTGKDDFDVFVAVTDADNNPLGGYPVVATHSSGQQVESQMSVDRWSENSGAMHYKAANIKLHVEHSPSGNWRLTVEDQSGRLVAVPVDLVFDPSAPQWYFLLFRLSDD